MPQLNVSLASALKAWIDRRVAEGRYSSASDYVRDLVRRDQDAAEDETEWLKGLIAEGLASGVSDETPETIIDNVIARRHVRRG